MTYSSPLSDPLTYVRAIGHVFGHSGLVVQDNISQLGHIAGGAFGAGLR